MRAAMRLERALLASAARAGAALAIARHASVEWRSATFAGERHVIEAEAPAGAALEAWLASLGADAIRVPGHMVADLRTVACARDGAAARVRIEGLTVALG